MDSNEKDERLQEDQYDYISSSRIKHKKVIIQDVYFPRKFLIAAKLLD